MDLNDLGKEQLLNYSHYMSSIYHRTGSLLLSFKSTNNKINELFALTTWYKPDNSRIENKLRMKDHGAAMFGYSKHHKELTIIGIAKTIEDLVVDINEYSNFQFDFWKSTMSIDYFSEMKYVRQLNNSIKHSRGIVLNDGSPSNKYLLEVCGVPENTDIGAFLKIDIEELIRKSFLFQMDLALQVLNIENNFKQIIDLNEIDKLLIPETFEL